MKNQDAYGSRPVKRLKYGMAFLALVGIGIVSCEKEEVVGDSSISLESENENRNSIQDVVIEWNSNGGNNVWSSNDLTQEVEWERTGTTNQNFNATIFIGELEADSVLIISKNSSALSYSYGGQTYQMGNITISGNVFQATVSGPNNVPTNLKITDPTGDFNSEFNSLAANDIILVGNGDEQEFACPWCLIWAGASLIAHIIDAGCSYNIQQDVAACTANGKCSTVHSCSATCKPC